MKKTQLALALLTSLSIIACSSGSNDQPGENAQLVALRNEKAANDKKVAELEERIKTLQSEKSALTSAQEALEKAKAALETDKQNLEKLLAEQSAITPAQMQVLTQEIADKSKQVSDLQTTVANQVNQIASLQKQVADLVADEESRLKAEEAAKRAQEAKEAAEKALAEQEAAAKAAKEAEERQKQEDAAKQAAEEARKQAESEKLAKQAIVAQYASSYYADKEDSLVYKTLTDESAKQAFIDEVKGRNNLTAGNCATTDRSVCSKKTQAGTVIQSYQQSYAGYAVIRETAPRDENMEETLAQASTPNNAFVYYVEQPTADKNAIVEGTYKGMVSYSRRNTGVVTSNGNLVLNVKGDQISGKVTTGVGARARDVITFNQGQIQQQGNQVNFNGSVTFHNGSFANDDKADFSGSYRGTFGGETGQQVAGVFESESTQAVERKDANGVSVLDAKGHRIYDAQKSVQGAFLAERE